MDGQRAITPTGSISRRRTGLADPTPADEVDVGQRTLLVEPTKLVNDATL